MLALGPTLNLFPMMAGNNTCLHGRKGKIMQNEKERSNNKDLDTEVFTIDEDKKSVDIFDIEKVSIDVFTSWLKSGFSIAYNLKTIFSAEEGEGCDGFIFGTDAYGLDFGAGYLSDPTSVMKSLTDTTHWEAYQEQA